MLGKPRVRVVGGGRLSVGLRGKPRWRARIIDARGVTRLRVPSTHGETVTPPLPAGMYIVRFTARDGTQRRERVLITP